MKEYLFSYGTLQKSEVQIDVFGRVLKGETDVLVGYTVGLIEITDETFLTKEEEKFQRTLVRSDSRSDSITGTALEITSEELSLADKYEPDNYKRNKVKLESGREAWIYLAATS
jgi:hypothetical protein